MTRAYLSLGSNLGNRLRYLRHVVQALHEAGARHVADGVPGVQVLRVLVGDAIIERPELTLPHPRMWTRGFVMRPLDDLLPGVFPPCDATGVEWFAAAEAIALPSPTREATRPANVL
jgi:2-amino-4-hydroxy-6-hydroxymethyldihydropteridine diphosphokinase